MTEYGKFASMWVNGELPGFIYYAFSINTLTMTIKKEPQGGAAPDCRPVAPPHPLRRAIEKGIMNEAQETFGEVFAPQQLSVGIKGGAALLVMQLQSLL